MIRDTERETQWMSEIHGKNDCIISIVAFQSPPPSKQDGGDNILGAYSLNRVFGVVPNEPVNKVK